MEIVSECEYRLSEVFGTSPALSAGVLLWCNLYLGGKVRRGRLNVSLITLTLLVACHAQSYNFYDFRLDFP